MSNSYVVFGAYGGVGSALCRRLSNKGAALLLAGRDETRLATWQRNWVRKFSL